MGEGRLLSRLQLLPAGLLRKHGNMAGSCPAPGGNGARHALA